MKCVYKLLIIAISFPFISCVQDYSNRTWVGEQNAKEEVNKAIGDKKYQPFYDTLIRYKETVIAIAEPILFNIYGRKLIVSERPYECYLVNGYWYISGTLPKNTLGGTFEIILNSKNAEVIKLIHGK